MSRTTTTTVLRASFLLISLFFVVRGQDTEITRVKPLTEEEKRLPQAGEKTRSIYLVNLIPLPYHGQGQAQNGDPNGNNQLNDPANFPSDPRGRNPTLFQLQKVEDNGRLPDGIYYRPAEDETQTPAPVFQKDLTDLQSYILARGAHKNPGRQ